MKTKSNILVHFAYTASRTRMRQKGIKTHYISAANRGHVPHSLVWRQHSMHLHQRKAQTYAPIAVRSSPTRLNGIAVLNI